MTTSSPAGHQIHNHWALCSLIASVVHSRATTRSSSSRPTPSESCPPRARNTSRPRPPAMLLEPSEPLNVSSPPPPLRTTPPRKTSSPRLPSRKQIPSPLRRSLPRPPLRRSPPISVWSQRPSREDVVTPSSLDRVNRKVELLRRSQPPVPSQAVCAQPAPDLITAPAPAHRVSAPRPPRRRSRPAPPQTRSRPPRAMTTSWPDRAAITSRWGVPWRLSFPAVPTMVAT